MATDQTKVDLHTALSKRIAALHPASWNKTWEKSAEAAMNKTPGKYGTELAKLEKRIAAMEEKQAEAMALQDQVDECNEILQRLDGKSDTFQSRVTSCQKSYQELFGKDTCLLEKPKQVEKLRERVKKLEADYEKKEAEGGAGEKKRRKKVSTPQAAPAAPTAPVSRLLKGKECTDYMSTLLDLTEKKNNPSTALYQMRDAIVDAFEKFVTSGHPEEAFEYDVGPIDFLIAPPPLTAAAAVAQKPPAKRGASAAASAAKSKKDPLVLCNHKVGGCATKVKALYAESVCLNCFKTHLKEKIRTLDDIPADMEKEYKLVYPSDKKTAAADPKKLAALLLAQPGIEGPIVSLGEDIRNAKDDDEEEEDDEDDEEDDSLVVNDSEVSYASSSSSSSESESDHYDDEKNADKKRGRAVSNPAPAGGGIGQIAHRILMAKMRTPMESRIKELCELHAKAATAKDSDEQNKYLAAADVALEKLEGLQNVFVIDFAYEKLRKPWPEVFLNYEEAEAKLAHLKSQYPGSNGEVQEKVLH